MVTARRSQGGTDSQTAVRILFLLDRLGTSVPQQCPVSNAVKVIESETKLQKLDFWLRNPDYLAAEVLNDVEAGTLDRQVGIAEATALLDEGVPELHTYPMMRYLRGAWERKDNSFALLKSLGHITVRRDSPTGYSQRARRDFYLLTKGQEAVVSLRRDFPPLRWYDAQAERIARFASDYSGADCKKRQYANPIYVQTPLGAPIPSIANAVRERLLALMGEEAA